MFPTLTSENTLFKYLEAIVSPILLLSLRQYLNIYAGHRIFPRERERRGVQDEMRTRSLVICSLPFYVCKKISHRNKK